MLASQAMKVEGFGLGAGALVAFGACLVVLPVAGLRDSGVAVGVAVAEGAVSALAAARGDGESPLSNAAPIMMPTTSKTAAIAPHLMSFIAPIITAVWAGDPGRQDARPRTAPSQSRFLRCGRRA